MKERERERGRGNEEKVLPSLRKIGPENPFKAGRGARARAMTELSVRMSEVLWRIQVVLTAPPPPPPTDLKGNKRRANYTNSFLMGRWSFTSLSPFLPRHLAANGDALPPEFCFCGQRIAARPSILATTITKTTTVIY